MPLITLDNVDKSFGAQRLFAGVSFAIDVRDHAVLVGPNGSGKTTLLRLIAGTEHPDTGRIARARGRRIWMHEQTPELSADRPVRDYLTDAFGELVELERELRRTEERLAGLREDSPELRDTMRAYQHLERRFETSGGYHEPASLDSVLSGLGLPPRLLDLDLLRLSGGELTRVTLARALLAEADLLLLDEPTNHLDIDSVEWLEEFLAGYPGAFVLVTHDRRLLESVGSRVLAVERDHVETLSADFATYVREREAGLELMAKRYDQDLEKIEQLQRFYDRFHAKKDKAKEAKGKLTQIERLKRDLTPPPRPARTLHLGLPQPRPSSRVVLEVRAPRLVVGSEADAPAGKGAELAPGTAGDSPAGGDHTRGPRVLVRSLDFVVERGEKIALVGPNGCGKTTLMETIAGLRSLGEGAVHIGHNVRPAYFSQQGRELDPDDTMLETVLPYTGHDEQAARTLLGRFLFPGDDVFKRVESLSGGERSRLRLLTLLVGDANFLLLDEPTNHLDMDSVDALGTALNDYSASLLFVTHDRHLIDTVATRVLEIHGGRLVGHLSAERYWDARAARRPAEDDARPAAKPAGGARRETPAQSAAAGGTQRDRGEVKPPGAEETRRRRARLRGLESEILKLEKRLGDIDAELAEPSTYEDRDAAAALAAERGAADERLQELYAAWEGAVDDVV
jgi:ATP-binding cassette subfamily F protein 3